MFYCNSTLFGLSLSSLNQLQKIQNNAARLVPCEQKSDHVIPLLEKLHWLRVDDRIHYKTATLAFRHFESSLPPYLSEPLYTYQPSRTLRSSSEKLLKVPKANLKSAGNRFFHYQAAKIWNSLPTNVLHLSPLSRKIWKHIFSKNAPLSVCKTPFLHSLTVEWMCGCRGGGVNMIADVLYSVNMYILFCVKHFELSHVTDIAL